MFLHKSSTSSNAAVCKCDLSDAGESDEESETEDEEEGEKAEGEDLQDSDEESEQKKDEEANGAEMSSAEKEKQQDRLKKVGHRTGDKYFGESSRDIFSPICSLQKKEMKVKTGAVTKENPWEKNRQERQEYRLRERMIKKKHRNLYRSMMKGREERSKQIWLLRKKRRLHDAAEKEKRKEERKQKKSKPIE